MVLDGHRVIMTVFAGRRRYMTILMKYVAALLRAGTIDEFHVWDFTRLAEDAAYIADPASPGFADLRVKRFAVKDKKRWTEYYDHYARAYEGRTDTILLKVDDDIVFMDLPGMRDMLRFRIAHPEFLFVFPTIFNNGLVAFLMQHVCQPRRIPEDAPHDFEHSLTGFETLVDDGEKGAWLHETFLADAAARTPAERYGLCECIRIPKDQRISINMFAMLSRDLHFLLADITDDEKYLTQQLPAIADREHVLYTRCDVVHFAFEPQRATGLGGATEARLLARYEELATRAGAAPEAAPASLASPASPATASQPPSTATASRGGKQA